MNFVPPSINDVNLSQQPSALKIENSAIKKIKTQIERLFKNIALFLRSLEHYVSFEIVEFVKINKQLIISYLVFAFFHWDMENRGNRRRHYWFHGLLPSTVSYKKCKQKILTKM